MSDTHDTGHIWQSLAVNVAIAVGKGVAAVVSGSGAMLAETLHSGADCGNQLLLLLGVRQAQRPADAQHPLGYGAALYFWSFMVALLLFSLGGAYSVYEGVHKFSHPEAVGDLTWPFAVLGGSLLLEGGATLGNIRTLNQRRGELPFFRYLRETKDSDLIVIFGENAAAVLGLVFALLALLAAWMTGDGRYDAIGSIAVGVVLIGVAIFLAVEVQSLLVGERADASVDVHVQAAAAEDARILSAFRLITVQKGPGEVMVAAKLELASDLDTAGVVDTINRFERRLKELAPAVRWCFVEPDVPKRGPNQEITPTAED
ncbi:MAG: cation diffusion facilitator family transporter [Deltaproteobacteria bacterium]|nr:cation diffusion facilitator family transporter [Deltaproteobacteria bacterium]